MAYIKKPTTTVCDFCGVSEDETIDNDGIRSDPDGWGTVEWNSSVHDYQRKDLCPKCLAKVLEGVRG
jgi:hypothetical protein